MPHVRCPSINMSPSAVYQPVVETPIFNKNDLLKVQHAPFTYRNTTCKKPVADDYMYAFKYNFPLPTYNDGTNVLDFTQKDESGLEAIALRVLKQMEQVIQSRDSQAFADMFLDCGKFRVPMRTRQSQH